MDMRFPILAFYIKVCVSRELGVKALRRPPLSLESGGVPVCELSSHSLFCRFLFIYFITPFYPIPVGSLSSFGVTI